MITFEKIVKHTKILNPLKDFKEDIITFEYRTDPLTGRNTTVIKGMLNNVNKFLGSDIKIINSLIKKSRANCPFCPESIKEKTPKFTQDFLKEGRFFVGDAVVIPNLLGHAERSIVVVISKEHYLKLKAFNQKLILDGFKGGLAYIKRQMEVEPSIRFPVFIFNYLPPAGSSIVHPHMQVLARDRPFYLVNLLLKKSIIYHENKKSNYWHDLISKEKTGDRYLFEKNNVEWIVPFAPLRGLNEVQAIVKGKSNFMELTNDEWFGLAEGISKILQFYDEQGYVSFNVILISGPVDKHLDYFNVNLRMISRTGIQASSFTDAWALPYLLWDGEAIEEPELFTRRIRAFIKGFDLKK